MTQNPRRKALSSHNLSGVGLACLAVAFLTIQGCTGKVAATSSRKGEGAVPVVVAKASHRDVPIEVQVIGNVEALSTIAVKAQVGGELTLVSFREGDFVKKGELLFTIDQRPMEAQVKQAEASIARDNAGLNLAQANLARDEANEKYARAQAARYLKLFQEGVMSKEQTDQLQSSADALAQSVNADRAAIESAKAQIGASKAMLENAKVQLGYTTIRSPIDGRTGNLMVKQGNIVSANNTDLMTINQVTPIYVTFSIPEAHLPEVKKYSSEGKLSVMATPQNDESTREAGGMTFIDNKVDSTTGTIKLKGTFPNTARKLWPGQFARVVLRLTTKTDAVVVPNQAVQTGQDGQFVFVVNAEGKADMRTVVTGARIDQDLVIDKGLQAGETVVTEGQLRLVPGSRVQLRDGAGARPAGGR